MQRRSVFKDETKLDINYVPHKLPHRDSELHLLNEFFSFLLQFPEKMAQRVIVTGNVGTGKTVLCQRFGADAIHEANKRGINIRYVHVNYRECRGSLFLILNHVISVFHPNFPRRGYSAEELMRILMQMLDEEGVHVILALDEFDSLINSEGSEGIYKLTRLQEMRANKPQRLSLICILRNLDAITRLDASTRSTLQSNVVRLEYYSQEQLVDILNDRVSLAFKPSSIMEDTVRVVAELGFSENGNARFAIELLWRAGKYADAEELDAVTPECVRKAVSSIIPVLQKNELATLTLHERLFLLGASRLFKQSQKAEISLAEAEQAYAIACEEFAVHPHTHTQLWKYVQTLSGVGVVETQVSGADKRGRSTLIRLPRVSASELEKQLVLLLAEGWTQT